MGDDFKRWEVQTRLSTLQTIAFHQLQASASASSIPDGLALGCSAPGMLPAQTLAEIGSAERELARLRFRARASAAQVRRKAPTSQRCVDPESSK